MNSNSDKLTHQNMSKDASLASLESGFINLTGFKTKEQMAVEIGLISNKIEKKKATKIFIKRGKGAYSFEELDEKKNDLVNKASWGSTTNCFSSINYNHLASLFNKFMVTIFLILVFVFVTAFFSYISIDVVFYSINCKKDSLDSTIFFGSLILSISFAGLLFYFVALHKTLINLQPSLTTSKCFSTLFKIIPNVLVFIIAFLSLIVIFSSFHVNITSLTIENTYNFEVRVFGAFFFSCCFFCSLYLYSSCLKTVINKFPLTIDSIVEFFV
ncbi:unnamed protein product [Meloidogyne enterolobii]|uniref:Uncharacterized protein n=1 Tax=Meloidogyne enterolobii TaxID=390850 RepID=A0ACB1AVB6_MELEN